MKSMPKWLSKGSPSRPAPRARLRLEELEQRQVMTVTYHGGALLPHVEVQGLYYGQNWYYNGANYQLTGALEGYLRFLPNSTYMDMLTNAGYGVGRGSDTAGRIGLTNPNPYYFLTDSQIRQQLQAYIDSPGSGIATPDSNRLYVIFVEPNIAVMNDHDFIPQQGRYANSIQDFLGYHGAFAGNDGHGHAADIHYAIITYPGGFVNNAGIRGVSAFDDMTEVASHEIAEAVTDPNVNYKALGWYDNQRGEIGDIVAGQAVRLNGYLVQKEAGKNDQPLTPAGATSAFSMLAGLAPSGTGDDFAPRTRSVTATLPPGSSSVLEVTPHARAGASKGTAVTVEQLADAVFAADDLTRPLW
jgi:hypothetical protein